MYLSNSETGLLIIYNFWSNYHFKKIHIPNKFMKQFIPVECLALDTDLNFYLLIMILEKEYYINVSPLLLHHFLSESLDSPVSESS